VKILGIDDMTHAELADEIERGGKFVIYEYCVSLIVVTMKQPSNIHFVRADHSRVAKGLPFTALSLVTGWWGFPFGPIYTIWALAVNFGGGKDVTADVFQAMR